MPVADAELHVSIDDMREALAETLAESIDSAINERIAKQLRLVVMAIDGLRFGDEAHARRASDRLKRFIEEQKG